MCHVCRVCYYRIDEVACLRHATWDEVTCLSLQNIYVTCLCNATGDEVT